MTKCDHQCGMLVGWKLCGLRAEYFYIATDVFGRTQHAYFARCAWHKTDGDYLNRRVTEADYVVGLVMDT